MSTSYESFGKYVLLEKLATGGMAEVFLARGSGAGGIGKFFAIKRILPQYADSPEFNEMFKDEAKIAINLNHSNIVSIHEFGIEKGQFYLVMDYVEGRNLRQIMNKMKKSNLQFSMDQIVYMVKEVAGGLDHAHRCIDGSTGKPLNITHRDMSPQNVMVSFEGETKVVDFGIAKAESQLETTRAGTLKGKFGYMSPEQAEGQPVDLRTDIFSLGIVLWEMLANDRLFVANNEINTLRKIRDCQIPSLRKINPNIHSELERIVQKALARDRNLRYQTAAALHRDLNRFLNRQYPDFSPQDFAVFIKSAFADEILSLRKRLVDYTKLNPNTAGTGPTANHPSNVKNEDPERTALMDTNTNSLIVNVTATGSTAMQLEDPGGFGAPLSNASPDSFGQINLNESTQTDSAALPENLRSSPMPVLDDKAIAAEMQREISVQTRVHSMLEPQEEITSPSISKVTTRPTPPRPVMAPPPLIKPKPKTNGGSIRFATFLVFFMCCVAAYSYLVKYWTVQMAPVIAVTDPFLHELHAQLGVMGQPQNSPLPVTVATGPDAPSHKDPATTPAPQPVAEPVTAPQPAAPVKLRLMVTSAPSGAEILVNGVSTGYVTPNVIMIPAGEPVSVTVRKRGFQEVTQTAVQAEINPRVDIKLQKFATAKVDIDVTPHHSGNIVYVNGVQSENRLPLKEVSIPAGQDVKIRAENKATGTYEEVTVNVPPEKHQVLQLNMKKLLRVPSNSPNR